MVQLMLCCGLILLICITSSKVLYKFGVPLLLIFIFLGMIFGIIGIDFSDFKLTGEIASIALVFIMFMVVLELIGVWLDQRQYLLF